ncbi:MAG: PIN domain-containing protein [Anaerolineae bacterium]|nr:PIN domain-containing protein [Anaerolineae bacterium]
MKTYVIDTHALAWYLDDDPRLGSQAEAVLDNSDVRVIIPAIVLAEIKYLAHKGRLTQSLDEVLRVIGSDPRCTIYPIDLSVVSKAPLGLDIHDSLIVGTALVQREAITGILTQDEAIASSDLIPTLW